MVLALVALAICVATSAQQDRDTSGVPKTSVNAPPPEARVDINRATVDEMMKVPGLTRVWAQRIIRFRPYRTKADLEEQGIIPAELYGRIEDYIIAHHLKQ